MADELGFDWVSVSEHHYSPIILAPSVAPLAGALTQIVRHARIALLGPLASINNPVRIAEEIAILDQLSEGRINVCRSAARPIEFNTYVLVDAAETQGRTQEASRLIRKALSEPKPFTWEGEHFQFPRIAVWPRALQQPFPPMYFSGNSLNSALFAAREHLGVCLSYHKTNVVADTVAQYRAEAAAAGWEPTPDHLVYRGFAIVADTNERAAELETTFLPKSLRFLLEGPVPPMHGSAVSATNGDAHTVESSPVPFGVGRMLFVGSPDTVVERIREFEAATGIGVIDVMFGAGQTPDEDVRRSIELFGSEVLPRIRELGPAQQRTVAATA